MRAMVTAAVMTLGLAIARDARAGACPEAQLDVYPDGAAAVPTNVAVRVVFDADVVDAVQLAADGSRRIEASGGVTAATSDVSVRDADGRAVAATVTRSTGAAHPIATVTPKAALAASSAYVVVVRDGAAEYVVARFTTGAGVDDLAPVLAELGKPRVQRWKPSKPVHWKDPQGAYADVAVGAVDAIGFEIFDDEAATNLRAVVGAHGKTLRLGVTSSCGSPALALPDPPATLWLRAFDAAGNPSALRPVVIDPARRRRR